ncbi:rhamnan synthesis F family protein [Alteromonas halophila]|nr:rhamnan synthesis F family protein [Alteromonas halophila]
MGDNLMGASFANQQGHFEDHALVKIHDQMLGANGYDWRCTDTQLTVPTFLQSKLTDYINVRSDTDAPYIGVKDPRAVHFFDAWQHATNNRVKAIFVYRDWRYCVSSLLKRHSRELLHYTCPMQQRELDFAFWQSPDLAARLWLASSRAMLQWMDSAPNNTLLLPLSSLLNQSASLFAQARKKGIPEALFSLSTSFDNSLLQSTIPASLLEMLPNDLQTECDDVQEQLIHQCGVTASHETVQLSSPHVLSKPGNQNSSFQPARISAQVNIDGLSISEALAVLQALPAEKAATFPWQTLMTMPCEDAKSWETIYKIANACNQNQVAEAAITRAITLQPVPWRVMYLGDLYLSQKQLRLARQCYLNAKDMAPGNATFFARLADVATEEGNYEDAQALIDEALALDATKPAIVSAQKRLADRDKSYEQRTQKNERNTNEMPAITRYMDVVDVLTNEPEHGKALDDYFVRYMFVRRNNPAWLSSALGQLSEKQGQCLQDYLFAHLERYWPHEVLETEMYGALSANTELPALLSKEQVGADACIGVHLHVYYRHLVPEILAFLRNIPQTFRLVVTCSIHDKTYLEQILPSTSDILTVENRGRDIAPWLMQACPRLSDCDWVLKLHTKSTPHAPHLSGWRLQLLWALVGDKKHTSQIVSALQSKAKTGILLPPYHPAIVKDIHWGNNREDTERLAKQLRLPLPESAPQFPAGSMFWYRPDALTPLTRYNWRLEDFPDESGQTDGTTMHAIERLISIAAQNTGMRSEFISML